MATAINYHNVLSDLEYRLTSINSLIGFVKTEMHWLSGCPSAAVAPAPAPLRTEHLLPFEGKWIAVDRSGKQEMIVATGDTEVEARQLTAPTYQDVVFREVFAVNHQEQ